VIAPDEKFYVQEKNMTLFSHGGLMFWFITCLIFSIIYLICFSLRWTPCRRRMPLTSKRSFYVYTLVLSVLNLIQSIGSLLYRLDVAEGLCAIDVTTYLYFTLFTPFVYWTFLSSFFTPQTSSVMFSYKLQTDDGLMDEPMEPHGSSVPRLAISHGMSSNSIGTTDSADFIFQQRPNDSESHSNLVASSSFSPEEMPTSVIS